MERLGHLRSTHEPKRLAYALLPAFALVALSAFVALIYARRFDTSTLAIATPFAILAAVAASAIAIRRRRFLVELHAHGVVVTTGSSRDVVLFEDVDELWLELDRADSPWGMIATVRALRLVDHGGAAHRVPVGGDAPPELVRWISQHCSQRLAPAAVNAIREGDTLTFGDVRIDRTGIRTPAWEASWIELRLVRIQPGRIVLFRRSKLVPWRVLKLDAVPHPGVLTRVVERCALVVDVDEAPLACAGG
jgi:hypothetical protein